MIGLSGVGFLNCDRFHLIRAEALVGRWAGKKQGVVVQTAGFRNAKCGQTLWGTHYTSLQSESLWDTEILPKDVAAKLTTLAQAANVLGMMAK